MIVERPIRVAWSTLPGPKGTIYKATDTFRNEDVGRIVCRHDLDGLWHWVAYAVQGLEQKVAEGTCPTLELAKGDIELFLGVWPVDDEEPTLPGE